MALELVTTGLFYTLAFARPGIAPICRDLGDNASLNYLFSAMLFVLFASRT